MHEINPHAEQYSELRQPLRELCRQFDSRYWQQIEEQQAYPQEFVQALTAAGWLAALIPEQYGGAGLSTTEASVILEEINRSGANSGACHAQMYIMGALLRHGSPEQKQTYLPQIAAGQLRLQSFAVTEPSTGTDTTKTKTFARRQGDRYLVSGQKVFISRVQHSDLMLLLARTTPLDQVKRKTEGLSIFLVDLRQALGQGLTVRPIRNMVNHETNRAVLRQPRDPGRAADRPGGPGLPLYPRRHERRAHPDRRRVHRRRLLVYRQGPRLRQPARGVRPGRSARTRASSSRSRAPTPTYGQPT